ncbi:MAG: hypothetical protein WCE64_10580 [Bacteroidales bacterium]
MQLKEVITRHDRREFLNFPKKLYRDDPDWVCPLDSEIETIFDPAKNYLFRQGNAVRWILSDDDGRIIGRVAAFFDRVRSTTSRQPTGGLGFFEVIEKREAAFLLFDTAKNWLISNGMEAMDGPVNFGQTDTNWGLLVDGFMQQGFGMPYNKKYYKEFFEDYGFRNYYEQYSYHREIRYDNGELSTFPPRMMKIAEWISKRPGYSFSHFEFRNKDKYVNDVVEIYNSAWAVFKEDFTPLDPGLADATFRKAKPIIDEDLIWFAYSKDKPVAFFILFPDLNQIIKPFGGRLHLWNMVRFIYSKLTHKMTRVRAIVGGVHPSHQNSGLESAIFYYLYDVFKKKPWYKELELSWVGDFNPKMIAIYEALGARKAKTHVTYRFLMNRDTEFIRFKDEAEYPGIEGNVSTG